MELQTVVTPLQRLVLEHMAATGESYNALAKRGGLPRQTIQAIVQRDGHAMPRQATLVKLAQALQLPLHKVQAAAAASAASSPDGQHPVESDDALTVMLERAIDGLTDEHRQVLLATARALKKAQAGTG